MGQRILIFKLFFFFFFVLFFNQNVQAIKLIEGKAKVIDGDTINIENNKIRLYGIDAPEKDQTCRYEDLEWNCGIKSKIFLTELIDNKNLYCEVNDIDRYKRYVAICFLNNLNLNKTMVRSGWSIAYRYYSTQYIKDEEIAKKNKLGIWKGEFEEPYIFRKNKK